MSLDRTRPMPNLSVRDEDASTSSGAHTVVFVGDSITAGEVSSDWVSLIRHILPGWRCVNAGVNGDLAWNASQRLGPVIAQRPNVVVLLIGTNDVAASASRPLLDRLRTMQQLPIDFEASLAYYVKSIEAIMQGIRAQSDAQIVLVEIPPLGEDLESAINQKVNDYNGALHRIAKRAGATCLPLYGRLAAELPPGHSPRPYAYRRAPLALARFQRTVLGRSWDEISRGNGLVVLTDWVHLNDRGAAILAGLVGAELEQSLS